MSYVWKDGRVQVHHARSGTTMPDLSVSGQHVHYMWKNGNVQRVVRGSNHVSVYPSLSLSSEYDVLMLSLYFVLDCLPEGLMEKGIVLIPLPLLIFLSVLFSPLLFFTINKDGQYLIINYTCQIKIYGKNHLNQVIQIITAHSLVWNCRDFRGMCWCGEGRWGW